LELFVVVILTFDYRRQIYWWWIVV